MDAFRRLRSRRKSKGQADSFVSFAEAESGLKSPTNTWQSSTGRPSATIPRSSVDKKLSHEHFRSISSSTDPRGQTPNSRTQPLLAGITRPFLSTSTSRPGTAESLQDALNRAADAITNPDSVRAASSSSRQATYKSGKYIDIFAIAGQAGKVDTSYNEDIASRNLDTFAIAVDDTQYRYEPTSKYQEEVANRNAYHHAPARAPAMRSLPEGEQERNSMDRSNPINSHTAISSKDHPSRRGHNQDSTAYHRQHNRARDATDFLPAIPQEGSDENINTIIETPRKDRKSDSTVEKQSSRSRWSEQQISDGRLSHPDYDPIYSTSTRKQGHLRVSDVPSQASSANRRSDLSHVSERSMPSSNRSTRHSMEPKVDRNSGHQVSANEAQTRSRPTAGTVQKSYMTADGLKSEALRSPSTMSTTSSVKRSLNLGNRRVMDLTGDDSEVFSVTSYINTPQLHNATSDTFLKVQPAIIENYSASRILVSNDPAIPNARWSSALEPVLDLDQLARRSQMIAETAKLAAAANTLHPSQLDDRAITPPPPRALAFSPIQILTSTAPPKNFVFSPISTLSTSPRSSIGSLPPTDVTGIAPMPVQIIQVGKTLVSSNQAVSEPQMGIQRSNSNRISAKIAPLVKVFADISPEDAGKTQSTSVGSRPAPSKSASQRRLREVSEGLPKEKGVHEMVTIPRAAIDASASIIVSSSSIDQNNLAGILTRDFAMLPVEKPTVKRIEALTERKRTPRTNSKEDVMPTSVLKSSSSSGERRSRSTKSSNKVAFDEQAPVSVTSSKKAGKRPEKSSSKKNGKKTSSSSKKPRPVSIFDEEAFQRKQSEATAALLRLQESLQENLDEDESGQVTPLATPASRALSPVTNHGNIRTPDSQRPPIYYPSPSQAAMAMIAAATSSPRNRGRADVSAKSAAEYNQGSRDMTGMMAGSRSTTGEGALSRSTNPSRGPNSSRNGSVALNPMLAHIESNSKPPPSPGEVSLSAFPLPSSRAISPEMTHNPPSYVRDIAPAPVRRGSQGSRMSSASAFSIPVGMVPGRGSSLPVNRMVPPGPSTSTAMDSIASVIPPSKTNEVNASQIDVSTSL